MDTLWDTRADFYIPSNGTLLGRWWCAANQEHVKTDGTVVTITLDAAAATNEAQYITTVSFLGSTPKSTCSQIQSVYMLNGNSSGDILY